MKKSKLYIIVGILLTVICTLKINVYANDSKLLDSHLLKDKEDDTILLCDYSSTNTEDKVKILLNTKKHAIDPYGDFEFHYKEENKKWHTVSKNEVHYNIANSWLGVSDNFTCPKYSWVDTHGVDEICIGNNEHCGKKFERIKIELNTKSPSIFNKINEYITNGVYNDLEIDGNELNKPINERIIKKTRDYVNREYSFNSKNKIPNFIENYLNGLQSKKNTIDIQKSTAYKNYRNKVIKNIDEKVAKGEYSKETAERYKKNIPEEIDEVFEAPEKEDDGNNNIESLPEVNGTDCTALLTPSITKILKNILRFIQFTGPLLVVGLTIKDFILASLNGEQDEIKKSSKKFIKRVIAAILLFFIPTLVNLILDLTGVIPPISCLD